MGKYKLTNYQQKKKDKRERRVYYKNLFKQNMRGMIFDIIYNTSLDKPEYLMPVILED